MSLRDLADADLAILRVRVLEFQDSSVWTAARNEFIDDRTRIFTILTHEDTPAEKLKFAQGELAQVNRSIMLVENLLKAIDREQKRQRMAEERR